MASGPSREDGGASPRPLARGARMRGRGVACRVGRRASGGSQVVCAWGDQGGVGLHQGRVGREESRSLPARALHGAGAPRPNHLTSSDLI
eukprot:4292039-Prymnesium_polylepis.1